MKEDVEVPDRGMTADRGRAPSRPPRGKGTDYVYLALRNMIVRMELAPGQKIDEAAIVRRLGVSRTPVREAIVRLAADRLATILPNRGAQVSPLDALELTSYFEALELTHRALQYWASLRRSARDLERIEQAQRAYETAVVANDAFAMSERNLEFHQAIAAAAGNSMMGDFVLKLSVLGMRIGWIWYKDFTEGQQSDEIERTVADHREIVRAIRERRAEDADHLAHVHITAFRDRIFARLSATLGNAVAIDRR
jgi:DNA-binding GntR family transcriptional regulator